MRLTKALNIGSVIFQSGTPGYYKFIPPYPGVFKIECWGAEGGRRTNSAYGGRGGYASGTITTLPGDVFHIHVGGSGNSSSKRGYNGGGSAAHGYGGGGATDVRIGGNTLYDRVIVAGGGGSVGAANKPGGYGGGVSGESRTESYGSGGSGASQTSAGSYRGSFGNGGSGASGNSGYGGAGGGGWFGGGGVNPDGSYDDDRGGGGGSGYVLTKTSERPSGYNPDERFILKDTSLKNGGSSIPNASGSGTTVGHSGDGYVKITVLEWHQAICHYVIVSDDKKYIINDAFYDREAKQYIPVTDDIIKDYKKYYQKFSYSIKDPFIHRTIDSETFIPINKLGENIKIMRVDIFDPDLFLDAPTLDNVLFPEGVSLGRNITHDTGDKVTIAIKGMTSGSLYDLNMLRIDTDISCTIGIKCENDIYGKDMKVIKENELMIRGIPYDELPNHEIPFSEFDLLICFTEIGAKGKELKLIESLSKTLEALELDHEFDIYHDYDEDRVLVVPSSSHDTLVINKFDNSDKDVEKPMIEY